MKAINIMKKYLFSKISPASPAPVVLTLLEKMSMKELGSGSMDQVKMAGEKIDDYQTFVYRNFTPPSDYTTVRLLRTVNSEDLETMKKLEKMPGFRLSWWFTTTGPEVIPDPKYTDPEATKTFVRWVVWDTLKKV